MLNIDFFKQQVAEANCTELGELILMVPEFLKQNNIDSREKVEAWLNEERGKD